MGRPRFKDRIMQTCYESGRKFGTDPTSEFYCSPLGEDGPRCPRGGASHRCSYWRGRAGIINCTVPGSAGYAFWAAGRADAITHGAISPRWLALGIMGSGLATKDQLHTFLETDEARLPWEASR